jgi:hypothetical protein
MNALLDASVQLIQVALLLLIAVQNLGLRARLRAVEEKLANLLKAKSPDSLPLG